MGWGLNCSETVHSSIRLAFSDQRNQPGLAFTNKLWQTFRRRLKGKINFKNLKRGWGGGDRLPVFLLSKLSVCIVLSC